MTREAALEQSRQWMREQAALPLAPISRRPAGADIFLDVTIEGQRFQGARDGNTLQLVGPHCGCELGVASINHVSRYDHEPATWQLCKYGDQAHGPLALTPVGLRTLAVTFGLPIVPALARLIPLRDLFERESFYGSPAFAALHEWATRSPRRVAGLFGDAYLGLWPLSALEGRHIDSTTENVARARSRIAPVPADGAVPAVQHNHPR